VDTAREYTHRADFPAAKGGFARNLWLREQVLAWFAAQPPADRAHRPTPTTGTQARRATRTATVNAPTATAARRTASASAPGRVSP
jgi:hypothetical protein